LTESALAVVPPGVSVEEARNTLSPSLGRMKEIRIALEEGLQQNATAAGVEKITLPDPTASSLPSCVLTKYLTASYWDHIVSVTTRKCRFSNWVSGPGYYTSRLITVVNIDTRWVIFSHDALLMIKDAAMSHWLLHLYFHTVESKEPLCGYLNDFTRWGLSLLSKVGEEGYETIKGLEGLVKLRLIQISEQILDPVPQIVNMIRKYRQKARAWYQDKTLTKDQGIDKLWALVASISDPDELGEVFSFLKLLGHPYIDPVKGCESSRKLAQAHRSISPSAVKQLEWSFCHT
jgi:hypothetical protein